MALRRSAPDPQLLSLFEESGRNVQRSALLLRDLLSDYPEQAGLARDIVLCEQEGDRIVVVDRRVVADPQHVSFAAGR